MQCSVTNWKGHYGNLWESIKFRLWLAGFTFPLKLQEVIHKKTTYSISNWASEWKHHAQFESTVRVLISWNWTCALLARKIELKRKEESSLNYVIRLCLSNLCAGLPKRAEGGFPLCTLELVCFFNRPNIHWNGSCMTTLRWEWIIIAG